MEPRVHGLPIAWALAFGLIAASAAICLSPGAKACFAYTISCEGASFSDYDGGGEDVEYNAIYPAAVNLSSGGQSHIYDIIFQYSPGCGNTYSGKFLVLATALPPGWSYQLRNSGNTDINGASLGWSDSGLYHAYLQVTASGGASIGDYAQLSVRLWANDTAACNEHNTDDVITVTQISAGGPMKPYITLISPNGGEVIGSNYNRPIYWSALGGDGATSVKLEYTLDGLGGTWTEIAAVAPNTGVYYWQVPDTPSSKCFIRATVTDSGAPPNSHTDSSDAAFTIYSTSPQDIQLTLLSPNGGQTMAGGSTFIISWTAAGGVGAIEIALEYSTTGPGGSWILFTIAEPNDGYYQWDVPNENSVNCYIRISASDSTFPPNTAYIVSQSAFTITTGAVPEAGAVSGISPVLILCGMFSSFAAAAAWARRKDC